MPILQPVSSCCSHTPSLSPTPGFSLTLCNPWKEEPEIPAVHREHARVVLTSVLHFQLNCKAPGETQNSIFKQQLTNQMSLPNVNKVYTFLLLPTDYFHLGITAARSSYIKIKLFKAPSLNFQLKTHLSNPKSMWVCSLGFARYEIT